MVRLTGRLICAFGLLMGCGIPAPSPATPTHSGSLPASAPPSTAAPAATLEVSGSGTPHCQSFEGCSAVLLLEPAPARDLFDWVPGPSDLLFERGPSAGGVVVEGGVPAAPSLLSVGRWAVGLGVVHTSDSGICDTPACASPYFPTSGEILCLREFELTDRTVEVQIEASFDSPCAIEIALDPDPQRPTSTLRVPSWIPPDGGVMDDCHRRTVLFRFDVDGRPWYEDIDSGERIDIAPPEFAGATVRTGDLRTLVLPDGSEGAQEWSVSDLACVQYAGGYAWIGHDTGWDAWQYALGDEAAAAARAALEVVRRHAGGSPPAAASLTSSAIVKPDRASLRLIDAEIRQHRRDRWSTTLPGFYIVGPYGGPGTFADAIDSVAGIGSSAGWHWFVIGSEAGPPTSANGVIARSGKHFDTPAGNEIWAVDQTLTLWEDCAQLEIPPITPGPFEPGVETGIDPEGGILTAYIDDADRDGTTLVAVKFEDPSCAAHPVMGPLIDHLLSDD
jgi:hypothetical protein